MATMAELHKTFKLGSCWLVQVASGNKVEDKQEETMIVDRHCKHHVEFTMGLDCSEPGYRTRTLGQCGEYVIHSPSCITRVNPKGLTTYRTIEPWQLELYGFRFRRDGGRYDSYKVVTEFYSVA